MNALTLVNYLLEVEFRPYPFQKGGAVVYDSAPYTVVMFSRNYEITIFNSYLDAAGFEQQATSKDLGSGPLFMALKNDEFLAACAPGKGVPWLTSDRERLNEQEEALLLHAIAPWSPSVAPMLAGHASKDIYPLSDESGYAKPLPPEKLDYEHTPTSREHAREINSMLSRKHVGHVNVPFQGEWIDLPRLLNDAFDMMLDNYLKEHPPGNNYLEVKAEFRKRVAPFLRSDNGRRKAVKAYQTMFKDIKFRFAPDVVPYLR